MRMLIVATFGLLLLSTPQLAQAQSEPGNIARGYTLDPKPGMALQLEEAMKAHLAWRTQQGDPWTWNAFQVVNGDNFGHYIVRSGNHRWADLDAYDQWTTRTGANAHFATTVGPYLDAFSSRITQVNGALSRTPDDLNGMRLYAVTNYDVRLQSRFYAALAKFHQGIGKTNYPARYTTLTVANGGPTGALIVIPAENWAALKPPRKTLAQMLVEAYGETDAQEIMDQLGSAIHSATSSVLALRPDLSSN